MSDATIAAIGRALAEASSTFAYSRQDTDKKQMAALLTELCTAVRLEREEKKEEKPND